MRRREFLDQCNRAALWCALLPLCGCTTRAGLAAPVGSAATDPLRDLIDRFQRKLPEWLKETAVPGAGIAVIAQAKLAWRGAFGLSDAASRKPVDHRTMFEAASMSKPVFAYGVMKLCEAGLIDLDTPLTRYTPDRFLTGDARIDQITARHVLSHTGGFQNWRSEKDPLASLVSSS